MHRNRARHFATFQPHPFLFASLEWRISHICSQMGEDWPHKGMRNRQNRPMCDGRCYRDEGVFQQMNLLASLPTVIGTAAIAPALLVLWLLGAPGERPRPPPQVSAGVFLGGNHV